MAFEVWLAFFATAAIVIVTPGPSTLLVLAHGLSYGRRRAYATIAGVITADATHVVIAAFGLTALLAVSAEVFTVLKWVGVAYLIHLGLRYWRAGPLDLDATQGPQFAIMGATFVGIALIVMTFYAGFAGAIRHWFSTAGRHRRLNRGAGSLLIGAGVVLAGLRRA